MVVQFAMENPYRPVNFFKKLDFHDLPIEPRFLSQIVRMLDERGYELNRIRKFQVGRNPVQHRYIISVQPAHGLALAAFSEGKRGIYTFIENLPFGGLRREEIA